MNVSTDSIQQRYKNEIFGRFASRKVVLNQSDLNDLNMLRALEASTGWRDDQRKLVQINNAITKLAAIAQPVTESKNTDPVTQPKQTERQETLTVKATKLPSAPDTSPAERKATFINAWPSNVSRYSSTGTSYGWNSNYLDALIEGFNKGSQTQRGAHILATNKLINTPIDVSDRDAHRLNNQERASLTKEEQQYYKPLSSGLYAEIPAKNKEARSTRFGPDSEVLIVIGAEKDNGKIGFAQKAKELSDTLRKNFGIRRITILTEPSNEVITDNIEAMGASDSNRHAAIFVIGHGGSTLRKEYLADMGKDRTMGSVWLHGSGQNHVSVTEDSLKQTSARLAAKFNKVDIVVSACHSKAWVD